MTTLAAYQGNGWAVIGCDSRASADARAMDLATHKVVANGPYLIAVSGSSRGGNIAQFGWNPPAPPENANVEALDVFMTRKFIPKLRGEFVEAGFDAKNDSEGATHDSPLLVLVSGVIYPIEVDYSWDREVRNIYYAGSGGDVALGAMIALGIEDTSDPEVAANIIRRSIEIACEWDVYTSAPIIVKTQTKGKK